MTGKISLYVALVVGLRTPFVKAGTRFGKYDPLKFSTHVVNGLVEKFIDAPSRLDGLAGGGLLWPDRVESGSEPSGSGPTAGFISLMSVKETNQRKRSPAAGFAGAVCVASVQRRCRVNRLQAIAMRLRGGCGRAALEVAGCTIAV